MSPLSMLRGLTAMPHTPAAKRRFAPRRILPALALALLGAGLAAPIARAEIIDFDPAADPVPEILSPEDMARYGLLSQANIVYFFAPPSPGGEWVYAYYGSGVGFVNLQTGQIVPQAGEIPGIPLSDWVWTDAKTLAALHMEPLEDGRKFHRVALDATSGAVTATEVPGAVEGNIVSVGPDLSTVLVMEFEGQAPPARRVTLGPRYTGPEPELPEGIESADALPGSVNRHPLGTLEVQQAGFTLALQDLAGGNRRVLAEVPTGTSLAGLSWSPDAARLGIGLMTMPDWDGDRQRDNDPPHAGLPNLGSINVQEGLGLVSPDRNPLLTGTRLDVYQVADGSTAKTFLNIDYPQGLLSGISFAPDGRHALLVLATSSVLQDRPFPIYSQPGGLELQLLDQQLGYVRSLDIPDADSLGTGANFSPDGEHIILATPRETDTVIRAYDIAANTSWEAWTRPGSMWQALPAGEGVAFSHQNIDTPMELWTLAGLGSPAAEADARQVTFLNTPIRLASAIRWAEVSWEDEGGETLHGIYAYPESMPFPPPEPMPMVVWQQGGPGGQMTNDFGTSVENPYALLPNFGIPVFVANAAGRNVKSPAFYSAMADGRNFGQLDIAQIKAGVDHLVAAGIADADRVGITGCSYGGYFTLQSLRSYPGFYAAGNPQCSLVDLTEEFTFGYTPFVAYLMGRAPMADPNEYLADSPMYGTNRVTTPTLIFHGTKDFLPVPLINNIHDELDGKGTPVTFFRAAGYGHGLGMATDDEDNPIPGSGESGQAYAFQLQLQFFRDRLGVGPYVPSTRPTTVFLPVVGKGMTRD